MAIKRRSAHEDAAAPASAVPEQAGPEQAVPEQAVPAQAAEQAQPPGTAHDPAAHHLADPAAPAEGAAPQPAGGTKPAAADRSVTRTRISGLWIAIGCFALILVFLLIFIVQNATRVKISYLGFSGHLQLGIAMLFAALVGTVLTVLAGTARILQLRAAARRAKHHPPPR